MLTIGQLLKNARLKKKLSLIKIQNRTKIKKEFINLIENNDWDSLPEYAVVSGFVKNLAMALGISSTTANALLRRDYPPKEISINPKPDVQSKFVWSPKLTFVLGIVILVILVLGYLGFEYLKFIKPPYLEVISPKENEVLILEKVKVIGKTTTDVSLTINNQPVIIDQDGNFGSEIEVTKETKSLMFKAISRSGKVTEKSVNISVE